MATLTIKRSEWFRGRGSEESCLYQGVSDKPQRCCLGFYGNLLGLTDHEMNKKALPSDMGDERWPRTLVRGALEEADSRAVMTRIPHTYMPDVEFALMYINDEESLKDSEREEWITALFKKYLDTDVVFVD